MKKKKQKIINYILGNDEMVCPRCSADMEDRIRIGEKVTKTYYFSRFHYCISCGFIQLYEKYKVFAKKN